MNIILVAVTSINGRLTKGKDSNIYTWTSKEDSEFFFDLLNRAQLIVMGSKTYEQAKPMMKHKQGRLRMIITRDPQKFQDDVIPGQLEFSSQNIKDLIKDLGKRGYSETLLVGGAEVNTMFFKENLISEIYLTVEPKIFGEGKTMFKESDIEADLELMSMEKLNEKGTVLLKYKVIN